MSASNIARQSINAIRFLSADAIEKANSGHPGLPMGMAAPAYLLFKEFLNHNPANPDWPDRDRFVLSAGHGSMLLYSLLHLCGYDLPMSEIQSFRQKGSKTPGHPEYGRTPGVEITTGPLGQGFASAVGMAIAEKHMAAVFNQENSKIVDHRIWVIAGDGDMMEGVTHEAASLAGHLKLSNLIVLYDDNRISIDGPTSLAFTENVQARFEALGWRTEAVEDSEDLDALRAAYKRATDERERPTLIRIRTHIGYGAPNKQDTASAHGAPLGAKELSAAKTHLGWPTEPSFYVPKEVYAHMGELKAVGIERQEAWSKRLGAYPKEVGKEFMRRTTGALPENWENALPQFEAGKSISTRLVNPKVLDAVHDVFPELMGGSADLGPSCFTVFTGKKAFSADHRAGRNLHYGVREHAMAATMNGMMLHGGVRPFGSTFLVFADYLRPSLRTAALMKLPVIHVFTHDTIAVGEDGPTHQPIEQVASLRIIPGLTTFRPADAIEATEAWKYALANREGPVAMIHSRQNLPIIDRSKLRMRGGLQEGGYVLSDCEGKSPQLILIATGSEISLALEAQTALSANGIAVRVVNMPCWSLFEAQPVAYREEILPPAIKNRIVMEALSPFGWDRYAGPKGTILAMNGFGDSAPGDLLMKEFGFTVTAIVEAADRMLG